MNKLPVKGATVPISSRRQNVMKAAYGPQRSGSSSLKNRHPANRGEQIQLKARRMVIYQLGHTAAEIDCEIAEQDDEIRREK